MKSYFAKKILTFFSKLLFIYLCCVHFWIFIYNKNNLIIYEILIIVNFQKNLRNNYFKLNKFNREYL